MAGLGLMNLRILPAVGCEETARYVHMHVGRIVKADTGGRVWVESVEVSEHGGNSAIYQENWNSEPSI
jgi:6-pyruvoyltetrahydropterin/6-carboxytetrahydropterin synthase